MVSAADPSQGEPSVAATGDQGRPSATERPARRVVPRRARRKGLVMIWTGNGKGKTTAAMGLALRAAGHQMHVLFLQFIKGRWKTGERKSLPLLAPYVEHVVMGRGFTIPGLRDERIPMEDHAAAARAAFAFAQQAVHSGRYDVVILDEIMATIKAGFVTAAEVVDLARGKPPLLHLVLTGRNAPPELVEIADLVSEVQPVKHPFQAGIPAQRGIEF